MHLLINSFQFPNPSGCRRTPQFTNVSEYITVGGSPDAESLRAHPSMCGLSYNVQVGPEGSLGTGRDFKKT